MQDRHTMDDQFLSQMRDLAAAGHANDLDYDAVVARIAVDQFCALARPGVEDIERFAALATPALAKTDALSAARIAETLAQNERAPESVLVRLAECGEAAALVVFRSAPRLSTSFLLLRAERGAAAEAHAIAGRRDLDRPVVAALLRRTENDVLRRLVANSAIDIERGALLAIIPRGRSDAGLGRALLGRADFGAAALPLFLSADAGMRRTLIAEARRAELARLSPAMSPLEKARGAALAAAEAANRGAFASVVALALKAGRAAIDRMIDDEGGEPLALILAATGAGAARASDAITMLRPGLIDAASAGVRLALDTNPAAACRIVVAVTNGRAGELRRAAGEYGARGQNAEASLAPAISAAAVRRINRG